MIDEHSQHTLEFPKIISLIRGRCLTPFGKEEIDRLAPLFDKDEIDRRQTEISQMQDILRFGEAFPLYNMEDCREHLARAKTEGIFLDPADILLILDLVSMSIELHTYDKEGREKSPDIDEYLTQLRAFPELRTDILRIFDERGDIRDNASSNLKRIRHELHDNRRKIVSMLEKVLSGSHKQAGWQDDMVTMRNGRYVIPIPSSQYRNDVGILHDRSQTGATLFVEPAQSVDLNNRLNMLQQEERQELDRILRAITKEIAQRVIPLENNVSIIGKLDAIYACGKFANIIDARRPIIVEQSEIGLLEARHPLLLTQFENAKDVIASNIALGESRQVLLVTGPNTGGKTILLKTIGLLILMAQSGLPIPADEKSTVGIFDNVFADIGDEQSIELSLSTFSSHIRNIISGLEGLSKRVLLLFDEIGAGTDPKEGSALAESIILFAIKRGAKLAATTHYSQLKTLAMDHPEIENASLDFDMETLAPTYRLNIGIPGSSYAVEIAQRLGMPESICKNAADLVGSGEKSLSALISSLQDELVSVKEDKIRLSERLARAERLEKIFEEKSEALKRDVEDEKRERLADTEIFLDHTRREIEKLVAEIRSSKASDESVKSFHRNMQKRQQHLKKLQSASAPNIDTSTSFEIGDAVHILTLNQSGEIESFIGKEKAKVKVGNLTTTVELRNLQKLAQNQKPTGGTMVRQIASDRLESPEIHLRGMTVDEATDALDAFLDQAVMAGLKQVYVIHGKGSGTLRRTLSEYLKSHPEVASIRLGDWNEGGAGVTIAKLRA